VQQLRYSFADAAAIAEDQRAEVMGGKGAALARMTAMGLPVPPGFTLTTDACRQVMQSGWFAALDDELSFGIAALEEQMQRRLGDPSAPLLVSVRSGAPISMPGMMDTVLNAGMTTDVARALCAASGDERFGWDTYRRFVQSYVTVVAGADYEQVRALLHAHLSDDEGASLDGAALAAAAQAFRASLADAGYPIPADPRTQIQAAVASVFASWHSDRARVYRKIESISEDLGTAATIQAMTFGNLGARSGTGVAFSRDPSSGEARIVGDFLVGAQGEDVVAGTHATQPISELRAVWPEIADELDAASALLERDLADLADIEFTVEDGTFWLLQVRRGKRSPRAALRIAIDMAEAPEFPLSRAEALGRVSEILLDPPTAAADPTVDDGEVLARGLAASPGRAVGAVCTDIDVAIAAGARGDDIILFRRETAPADIAGMAAARGLVTTLGGLVSHAAVVARGWGVPAVVGVGGVEIEAEGIRVGDSWIAAGTVVTVDGDLGIVMAGAHPGAHAELQEVRVLRAWQEEAANARPVSAASSPGGEPVSAQDCERLLALKGMGNAEVVASILGCASAAVQPLIDALLAAEEAQELPGGRVRLLPVAIARVDALYRSDALRLTPVIEPLLHDFHAANDRFKEVVTSWQMREVGGETVPNDHEDAVYDTAVIDALAAEIHTVIVPIVEVVAEAEPRMQRYLVRFIGALDALRAGDGQMMAHPMKDSYHTVWFELHEELIRLSGRNRADEAAAGRA
jgi:pyruvate,orthophosphate dikinase